MFEAQSTGQPKLVYAHTGHSDSNRVKSDKALTTPRSVPASLYKNDVTNEQITSQKSLQKELLIIQRQDPQQKHEKVQKEQKEKRQEHTEQEHKEKEQERSRTKQTEVWRNLPLQEQPKQPKQIEVIISTKKAIAVSGEYVKRENVQSLSTNYTGDLNKEPIKTYPQHIPILNKSDTSRIGQTVIYESNRRPSEDVQICEKPLVVEKVEQVSPSTSVISTDSGRKIGVSSASNEHDVFSVTNKPNRDTFILKPESSCSDIASEKVSRLQSHVQSENKQIHLQHLLHKKEQQDLVQQTEQSLPNKAQQVHETRLHVTAIRVHSYPVTAQHASIMIPKSGNSEQSSIPHNFMKPVSHKPLTLSSSMSAPEAMSKLELNHDPDKDLDFPSFPAVASSANQPKSILKNSPSFDQTDMPLSSVPLLTHVGFKEMSPHLDFKPVLTFNKDQPSSKTSTSVAKEKSQYAVVTNNMFPQQQPKGTNKSEANKPKLAHKKGKAVLKKSVTFNSEVRLHLDDEMSTVQSLPVDA